MGGVGREWEPGRLHWQIRGALPRPTKSLSQPSYGASRPAQPSVQGGTELLGEKRQPRLVEGHHPHLVGAYALERGTRAQGAGGGWSEFVQAGGAAALQQALCLTGTGTGGGRTLF